MAFFAKPSSPQRNVWGRRSDQCVLDFPFNGSGAALTSIAKNPAGTNFGSAYVATGTGTGDTQASDGDADSIRTMSGTLDFSQVANHYMVAASPASDVVFNQFTLLMLVNMDTTTAGTLTLVTTTNEAGGAIRVADSMRIQMLDANKKFRARVYETDDTEHSLTSAAVVSGVPADYVLILRGSQSGADFFVNSLSDKASTSAPVRWKIPAGGHMRFMADHVAGGSGVTTFCPHELKAATLWRVWMDDTDLAELFTDPYQMQRPPAPARYRFRHNPLPCWGTTDGGAFNCPTSSTALPLPSQIWRLQYRVAGTSTWTASSAATVQGPNVANPIVLTGLTSGQRYEWLAEYFDTVEGYRLFPGGMGHFRPLYTAGSANTPKFVKVDDCHAGSSNRPRSDDLDEQGAYAGTNPDVTDGGISKGVNPVNLNAWKTAQHARREGPHWILWGGDNSMIDGYDEDEGAKTNNDIRDVAFDHIARHHSIWNDLTKSGWNYWVGGNHGHMGGYFQYADKDEEVAAQKQATVAWKTCYYPPLADTYSIGGVQGAEGDDYDSTADWRPTSGTDSAGNAFDASYLSTYIDDTAGVNAAPLGNFFAFISGNTLCMVLDNYRYSNVGDTIEGDYTTGAGGVHYQQQRVWVPGTTQTNWVEAINDAIPDTVTFRFCAQHQPFGGSQIPVAGNDDNGPFYGYGNMFTLYTASERWQSSEFAEHNYTALLFGHSHKASHVIRPNGLNVWVGGACAPSLSYISGWNEDVFSETFGTSASSWTDSIVDSDGNAVSATVQATYNAIGYTRIEGSSLKYIRTAFSRDWRFNDFENAGTPVRTPPTAMATTTLENERFVGAVTFGSDSFGVIDLGQTFSEVQLVLPESEITGDFWISPNDRLTTPAGLYAHMDYDAPLAETITCSVTSTVVRVAFAPDTIYSVTLSNAAPATGATTGEVSVEGVPIPGANSVEIGNGLTGAIVSINKQSIPGKA